MPVTDPTRIYIPVMKAFENGNVFTGSAGVLRFRLDPTEEEQADGTKTKQIRARTWYGEYCFEKSEIADDRRFPLSEEGRMALRDWLESLRDAAGG